jgi:hypothetical protein
MGAKRNACADPLVRELSAGASVNGSADGWPFLYHGREREPLFDLSNLYYAGAGNFYDPLIQRSLSEIGEQGLSGPGSEQSGNSIDPAAGGGGAGCRGSSRRLSPQPSRPTMSSAGKFEIRVVSLSRRNMENCG